MLNNKAYSSMLEQQVDICFPFEYGFFNKHGLNNVSTVVEVGCGNAYFLNKLKTCFPDPSYVGYDHNADMVKQAESYKKNDNFIVKLGSIDDIVEKADVVVLRLVLHQIKNRPSFLTDLIKRLDRDVKIIIIDPLDTKFQLEPDLPCFMQRLQDLRGVLSSGDAKRNVKDFIVSEMGELGFSMSDKEEYYIPSLLPSYKKMYRDYMIITSNMLDYSEEVVDELNKWYQNPKAFFQMGLFMCAFERKV